MFFAKAVARAVAVVAVAEYDRIAECDDAVYGVRFNIVIN